LERPVGHTSVVPVPPQTVLDAFGVAACNLRPLPGGQGQSFGTHDAVLKPVDDVAEARWIADVLDGLDENGFRLARPLRARTGDWVVEGWTAWERIAGDHDFTHRWPEVIELCRRLNAALAGVPRSPVLDSRESRYAIADRVAWDERTIPLPEVVVPLYRRLREGVRAESSVPQLVHGDLSGNVLFADRLEPGVIDFSPYWRPAGYAVAIVTVDALAWHHADATLVHSLERQEIELLGRAAVFRLVTSALFRAAEPHALEREIADFERLAGIIEARA
jgi:uncharacterized protein (TIGR02569 family)